MTGPDEITVDEAASLTDQFSATVYHHTLGYWCDTCFQPSIVKQTRRRVEIDADGVSSVESTHFYCTDHGRWIA